MIPANRTRVSLSSDEQAALRLGRAGAWRPLATTAPSPGGDGGAPVDELDVVVVDVAGHRCGLPAADVVELLRVAAVTPVPRTPPTIEGVINVRGTVLPVLDLRACLDLPTRPVRLTDHLVVVRADARLLALRVDRAVDLLVVPRSQVEGAVSLPAGAEHVSGAATLEDGLVLIYDSASFLSADEGTALDAALQGEAATAAGAGR